MLICRLLISVLFMMFSLTPRGRVLADEVTPTLKLEYAFVTQVQTADALVAERTPEGTSRWVPIIGGTITGPRIRGTILSGADSQVIRSDGVIVIEAHYMIRTDDNVMIAAVNRGLRHAAPAVMARLMKGEPVAREEYYFRTVSQLQAPIGSRYEDLNKHLFVATAERAAHGAALYFYQLD